MSKYLEQISTTMLRNLMLYPPVDGSRESHEAWKQNVRFLMEDMPAGDGISDIWLSLRKAGFVSPTLRNECISYAKTLTSK